MNMLFVIIMLESIFVFSFMQKFQGQVRVISCQAWVFPIFLPAPTLRHRYYDLIIFGAYPREDFLRKEGLGGKGGFRPREDIIIISPWHKPKPKKNFSWKSLFCFDIFGSFRSESELENLLFLNTLNFIILTKEFAKL